MPELGRNPTALGVDRLRDLFPAREALIAPEIGHIGIAVGRNVIDAGALSEDQSRAAGGAPAVVLDIGLSGDIVG